MNLFQTIIMSLVMITTKDIDKLNRIRENKKVKIIRRIILSVVGVLMVIFLTFNYFKTSINLDKFNIIEKVHDEKGICIYTISEEEKEKCLILKKNIIFNKLFFESKKPVQNMVIRDIDTFKYRHHIEIENSIIEHTYEKRWGDGVVSFWVILGAALYLGSEQDKLSKADKIIGILWFIITIGNTIYFII